MNAPITSIGTIYGIIGQDVTIPVTISNFSDIRAVSLTLKYNKDSLTFKQGNNTSGFEGLAFGGNIEGIVKIGGFNNGTSLPDNSEFFNLLFTCKGGTSDLTWVDYGESCEYAGMDLIPLTDKPTSDYYKNGSVINGNIPPYATLNGTVNPIGMYVVVSFELGETIEYGNIFEIGSFNDNQSIPISLQLSGGENGTTILKQNTLYHYRIKAVTSTNINIYGEDVTFMTPDELPIILTLPASNIN